MSVTNLTNTTWKLTANEWTATAGYGLFNVNCTLKQIHGGTFEWTDCTKFGVGYKVGSAHNFTTESNRVCVDVHYMTVQNYANVEVSFFGGADIENPNLISWLETNGELQKVTDLTGSTWVIPSGWTCESGYGEFNIYGSFQLDNENVYDWIGALAIGYKYAQTSAGIIKENNVLMMGSSWFSNTHNFIITIVAGEGVTNTSLISWLYANGYMTVLPTTEEPEQPTTPTKKFTRLYLGATAITSNGKRFRKLQNTEYVEPSEPSLPVWNGTDLTGTTWEVPSVWSATSGYGLFSIDYKVSFKIPDMTDHSYYNRDRLGIGYNANVYPSTNSICFCREAYNTYSTMTGTTEYLKGCVMTFTITGGTDATNTKLIDWLKQYGTLTSHTM